MHVVVQTREKYVEAPQERLQGSPRLLGDVRPEAVKILNDQVHQANEDLIRI